MTSAIYHDNDSTSTNPAFTWLYSSNGTPRAHKDFYNKLKYVYGYDAIGRLIRTDISSTQDNSAVASTEYGYNTRGHLTSITNEIGGNAYGQYYIYSETKDSNNTVIAGSKANAQDGLPTRYRTLGVDTDYSYDSLNRLRTKSVKVSDTLNLNNTYTYKDSLRGSGYATTQLATETIVGVEYGYNYDNMGNITSITRGGNAYREYLYDSLGQLTQERNLSTNTMTSYTYNHLGNITVKNIDDANGINEKAIVRYGYSKDSNAGWNYLLTSITTEDYTSGTKVTTTETIDYDAIGNPISYRGATMSWFGRQLRTYSKGSTTVSFVYDADGLRSSKTVNGTKTTYQYVGDQLFYEDRGNGNKLYYFYDSYGNLTRIYHHNNGNKAAYYVATNAQGDVVALYNASGKKVGAYDYDAWGNQRVFVVTQDSSGANVHTQINPETQYLTHIVNLNPIRYRGYFYDRDLGLYYLQSRYYDASIGRFVNADGYITTGQGVLSHNMYAYCLNNPVMYSDPSGYLGAVLFVLGYLVVDAIITVALVNHAINLNNSIKIENEIKDSYTKEETKEIIEETTGKDTVVFNDGTSNVLINDSYKITSRYERQKYCMIISRTEDCTQREYDNLSAEWYGHNLIYNARLEFGSVIPWDLVRTGNVNLDYIRDDDFGFVFVTKVLEVLGLD